MFALRRDGGGRDWWRRSALGGVIPMVSLLLIGYPLGWTAIRTALIGLVMAVAAVSQLLRKRSAVTVRVRVRTATETNREPGR